MFAIVVLLGTLGNAVLGYFELKMLIYGLKEVPLSLGHEVSFAGACANRTCGIQ